MNNLYLGGTYRFYVGWYRYSGGADKPWIACAIDIEMDDEFPEKFYDLDAGDMDARWALDYIKEHADFYAWGESPSKALQAVEELIANP